MAIPAPTERHLLALAVALGVASAARIAHAEPPRASLIVTRGPGAEDCPDAPGIEARIRPLARADVFATSPDAPPDTWIQVELSRELSGYRAVIAARGRRQGTRHIADVSPTCSSLADAVAITLVMLLDPEPPRPAPPPPPKDPAPVAPSPAPPPERERWLHPGAEAVGGASIGVLSHAAPMLEAGARLGLGNRVAVSAGGGFIFPDRALAPDGSGSVKLGLTYAYLQGAFTVLDNHSTRLALVLDPQLGSLSGAGSSGFETPGTRHLLWGAVAGGAEVFALLPPPFSWSARLLALVTPVHEGFSVMEGEKKHGVFQTPAVGGMLSVGVSASL